MSSSDRRPDKRFQRCFFYFSKSSPTLSLQSLFNVRLEHRIESSQELITAPLCLRLAEFTVEVYSSFSMEIMMLIDVWLGVQKLHLCRMCTAVQLKKYFKTSYSMELSYQHRNLKFIKLFHLLLANLNLISVFY